MGSAFARRSGGILRAKPFLGVTVNPAPLPPANQRIDPQPGRNAQQEKDDGEHHIVVSDALKDKGTVGRRGGCDRHADFALQKEHQMKGKRNAACAQQDFFCAEGSVPGAGRPSAGPRLPVRPWFAHSSPHIALRIAGHSFHAAISAAGRQYPRTVPAPPADTIRL